MTLVPKDPKVLRVIPVIQDHKVSRATQVTPETLDRKDHKV